MKLHPRLITFACLCGLGLLSGCGDTSGFGDTEGFGGYTKGFGDIKGFGNEEVGLCSYTGGCMPESNSGSGIGPAKRTDSSGDHAGDHTGSVDDSGTH